MGRRKNSYDLRSWTGKSAKEKRSEPETRHEDHRPVEHSSSNWDPIPSKKTLDPEDQERYGFKEPETPNPSNHAEYISYLTEGLAEQHLMRSAMVQGFTLDLMRADLEQIRTHEDSELRDTLLRRYHSVAEKVRVSPEEAPTWIATMVIRDWNKAKGNGHYKPEQKP